MESNIDINGPSSLNLVPNSPENSQQLADDKQSQITEVFVKTLQVPEKKGLFSCFRIRRTSIPPLKSSQQKIQDKLVKHGLKNVKVVVLADKLQGLPGVDQKKAKKGELVFRSVKEFAAHFNSYDLQECKDKKEMQNLTSFIDTVHRSGSMKDKKEMQNLTSFIDTVHRSGSMKEKKALKRQLVKLNKHLALSEKKGNLSAGYLKEIIDKKLEKIGEEKSPPTTAQIQRILAEAILNEKLPQALDQVHSMTIDAFRQAAMDPEGGRQSLQAIYDAIKDLPSAQSTSIEDVETKARCTVFVNQLRSGIEQILTATEQDSRPLEAIGHFCLEAKGKNEQKKFLAAKQALYSVLANRSEDPPTVGKFIIQDENKNLKKALNGFRKIDPAPYRNLLTKKVSSKEVKEMKKVVVEGITHALVREDIAFTVGKSSPFIQQFHSMDPSVLQTLQGVRNNASEEEIPVLPFAVLQEKGIDGHEKPLSSSIDKKGTVRGSQDGASNERLMIINNQIAVRASGRTDSVQRQEKNALLGLQQIVEKEGVESDKLRPLLDEKGDPIKDKNGKIILQYKPSIGTYQDVGSTVKWLMEAKRMPWQKKKFTECGSVKKIFQSANDFQPFRVQYEGVTIQVQKPLVQTESMNATARGEGSARRALNAPSIQDLEKDLRLQYKHCIKDTSPAGLTKSAELANIGNCCLQVLKTGNYPGDEGGQKMHPADREVFRQTLLHILGYDIKLECKSGTDRTISGFAIGAAIVACKDKYGKYFLPSGPQPSNSDKEKYFAEVFTETVEKCGLSMTTYTKGKFGIKWGLEFLLESITAKASNLFGVDKELVSPAPFRYLLIPDLKEGRLDQKNRKIRLNPNWANQGNPLTVTDPNHLKAIKRWLQGP